MRADGTVVLSSMSPVCDIVAPLGSKVPVLQFEGDLEFSESCPNNFQIQTFDIKIWRRTVGKKFVEKIQNKLTVAFVSGACPSTPPVFDRLSGLTP